MPHIKRKKSSEPLP